MDAMPKKRTKILSTLVIIALIGLVIAIDLKRRSAEQQLEKLSIQLEQLTGNQQQNKEIAKQVVDKVRKLIEIPADIEPTVATIVDVAALRKRNAFYNKAENGDYLVVTNERAILYDADKNMILDVIPVQIQAPAAQGGAASSK